MDIISVKLVYFSPTRTTKKGLEGIAEGIQVNKVNHIDLTPAETRTHRFEEFHNELAIIGIPVYSGRVPVDAVHRLRRIKANNTPAVIVVVYGNRDYDDALLELNNLALEIGFKPVAAGAFIGKHSLIPIANGRPDAEDLKKTREFGRKIWNKLNEVKSIGDISPPQIPGNFPYIELPSPKDTLKTHPVTQETLCTKCETCVTVCPTAAITINDTVMTDIDACILCCACANDCPNQARVMDTPNYQQIVESVSKRFSERKEPEIFI